LLTVVHEGVHLFDVDKVFNHLADRH
jgi:hypothetical protein